MFCVQQGERALFLPGWSAQARADASFLAEGQFDLSLTHRPPWGTPVRQRLHAFVKPSVLDTS